MPRARTGNQDLWMSRMKIQNEMFIRSSRIHADDSRFQFAGSRRYMSFQQGFGLPDFLRAHLAIQPVWLRDLALVMNRNLNAIAEIRKAVEKFVRLIFPNENGKSLRTEGLSG